jgi:bifunctional polynucleotide phosphatase/kinase
VRIRGG